MAGLLAPAVHRRKGGDGKCAWAVCIHHNRRADTAGADEMGQSGQGDRQLFRTRQRRFKQAELYHPLGSGSRGNLYSFNGLAGRVRGQIQAQQRRQDSRIRQGRGQRYRALKPAAVGELQRKANFFGGQAVRIELPAKAV